MYTRIKECRICGNKHLEQVLDLGEQTLTGVFPKEKNQSITCGPLRLVKCMGNNECCGLLQLEHSYDLSEMYGNNYGYRSGLNASMVSHLTNKIERILKLVDFSGSPLVLDIGSNDGTTLRAYADRADVCVGIDPTAIKFQQYYPKNAVIIPDFFSAAKFRETYPNRNARIITSFSMFYDLPRPMDFVNEIVKILDEQGVWAFEQSYMPLMLEKNSYDTVCHEHLEYYALKQIYWMTERAGLKIINIEFNDINGGSFSVMAAKRNSKYREDVQLHKILKQEQELGFDSLTPYINFANRVSLSRNILRNFVETETAKGKKIAGLGASTKGNVLLQYCGFTPKEICAIGEVNSEKYGCYTPGTLIPIIPELELFSQTPDFLVVLPWHFRDFFLNKHKPKKGKLVFPLPELEVIG